MSLASGKRGEECHGEGAVRVICSILVTRDPFRPTCGQDRRALVHFHDRCMFHGGGKGSGIGCVGTARRARRGKQALEAGLAMQHFADQDPIGCWSSCLFGHRELHISTGLRSTWSVDLDCGGRFLDAHWSTRSELHSFAIRHYHAMPTSGRERERESKSQRVGNICV